MARRNRNKYAAVAAARRGDWKAITDDTLDLLSSKELQVVAYELSTRRAPEQLRLMVLDELERARIEEDHAAETERCPSQPARL